MTQLTKQQEIDKAYAQHQAQQKAEKDKAWEVLEADRNKGK